MATDLGYRVIVEPDKYDYIEAFTDGFARVRIGNRENGKWGFIDKAGKEIISPIYDIVWPFYNGLTEAVINGYTYFIDTSGNEVMFMKDFGIYDYVDTFHNGYAWVSLNGKLGVIDTTGKEIIAPTLDYQGYYYFIDGLSRVAISDNAHEDGYIDLTGKEVIPPGKYDHVYPFNEGLSTFLVGDFDNGKWGVIDKTGKEIIPAIYSAPVIYYNGYAQVYNDDGYGIIDKLGNEFIPFGKYDYIYPFSNGLTSFFNDGKFGFIDTSGNEVIPPIFNFIVKPSSEGYVVFKSNENNNFGLIDHTGKIIVPAIYDYIDDVIDGFAIVRNGDYENGKYGIIEITATPGLSSASNWAVDPITKAYDKGFIPNVLTFNYKNNITRSEMCALIAKMYEAVTGAEITERKMFADTEDINIQKVGALGIVAGGSNNVFNPGGTLTHEQAAVILAKLAEKLGKPLTVENTTFSDSDKISTWAAAAVGKVQASGIMAGVGSNSFDPAGGYTREQSIATILKIWEWVSK